MITTRRRRNTEAVAALRRRRIADGVCVTCGAPLTDGSTMRFCPTHRELIRQRNKRNRLKESLRRAVCRCTRECDKDYARYGGRGIRVCQDWIDNPGHFEKWAMENGYRPGLELDRINPNGHYSPDNCRWATRQQQMRNIRSYKIKNPTSRFKGVSWNKGNRRWIAQISNNYKKIPLGNFVSALQAALAYDAAAYACDPSHCFINFPERYRSISNG